MNIVFLISEYVLHNHILETYHRARPEDNLLIVKVPLKLTAKSRLETAGKILPRLSRRFLVGKLIEFLGVGFLTFCPKILAKGAVFRRLNWIAKRLGAEYFETADINDDTTLVRIREFRSDVVVSLMHQVVRQPLIQIPRLGVVNIHPGIIPDFRGIQPYFWSLSEGASMGGCTLHLIENEEIDSGPILTTVKFSLENVKSVQMSYHLSSLAAGEALPRTIELLENGGLQGIVQDGYGGSYYRWPDSAAYDRLWLKGKRLLKLRDIWGILSGNFTRPEFQISCNLMHI